MNIILSDKGPVQKSADVSAILKEDYTVYEVFRVIQGIPLFLEDHFSRLINSMKLEHIASPLTYKEFLQKTVGLISLSQKTEGNIRFVILSKGNGQFWYFTFIPAVYPAADEILNGVDTDLFEAERVNPNAKVLQKNVRYTANDLIAERKLHEVLLTDREGFITEGSRSNVFFVKGDVFYTAPASKVLVGVTRQKVFDCLRELNYPLVEQAVHKSELQLFDAVFLTGTSPRVLPIKSVGILNFNPGHERVRQVMKKYDEMIDAYIENQERTRNS